MTKCVYCASTRSPAAANFCVDCGYAQRQDCAYEDCGGREIPLEMAAAPTLRCSAANGCRRYFRFCPNCHRLHRLNEQSCRTPRCKNHPLREPYHAFESLIGDETRGVSVEIPHAWARDKIAEFEGELTMPDAVGGLSFRYGKLFFAGDKTFASISANRRRSAPLQDRAVERIGLPSPLIADGAPPPPPYAMRVAHGFAYLLGESGPLRVDLANAEVQTAAQDVWQDADSFDAWEHFGQPIGDNTDAGQAPLDFANVRWLMQTTTSHSWLGVGDENGRLCVVQSDADAALFQVSRVTLPDNNALRPGNLVDVLPLGADVFWILRKQVWRLRAGCCELFWNAQSGYSLNGALQCGAHLLVWGHHDDTLMLCNLDLESAQIVGQPITFQAHDVYERPVRIGRRVFFFDHAIDDHAIVSVDAQNALAAPQRTPFVTNARALWAAGVECGERGWLVYALDDGTDVEFYARPVLPTIENAWPIAGKLRVRRDAAGGTLAATIADGHLAISAATQDGAKLHLFDLSGASNGAA